MLMYALIGLSLVLVGIVGLQFFYLFYVDRIYGERRRYLQALEKKHARLLQRLKETELRVAEQDRLLGILHSETDPSDDAWAEVIEDR